MFQKKKPHARDTSYWDFNRKLESPTPTTNRSSRGRVLCPINYNYNPWQKSWPACQLLQHLSGIFISSSPWPRFNVVYRDEFVMARFQHCLVGRGFPISVMSILTVSKIAWQRIFMLSDSRTFVVDCSSKVNCTGECRPTPHVSIPLGVCSKFVWRFNFHYHSLTFRMLLNEVTPWYHN